MKIFLAVLILCVAVVAEAARLKDIASLRGARDNQLLGYGIVIGLAGTGDKSSELTENSLNFALKGMGVDMKTTQKPETKNIAAVVVSATLPAFVKIGSRLDVTVSSIGSATSLNGGTLLATALRGPDGVVYAMSQGKIVTQKRGDGSSKVGGQTVVTASVPLGALLEKELNFDFAAHKELRYQLHQPDFTTAARASQRINEELGGKYATANDAATIDVILPYTFEGSPVDLIARLEGVEIEADRRAKIVLNQRTGTVVLGDNVQIAPVAIAHGNLKLEVKDPKAGKAGEDDGGAAASTKSKSVIPVQPGPSVAEVAASLNEMGATADDLVTLIQALKASGALTAEVELQ